MELLKMCFQEYHNYIAGKDLDNTRTKKFKDKEKEKASSKYSKVFSSMSFDSCLHPGNHHLR